MRRSRFALSLAALALSTTASAAFAAGCEGTPDPETVRSARQSVVRIFVGGERRERTAFIIGREGSKTFIVTAARDLPLGDYIAALGPAGESGQAKLPTTQGSGPTGELAILEVSPSGPGAAFTAQPLTLLDNSLQGGEKFSALGYLNTLDNYQTNLSSAVQEVGVSSVAGASGKLVLSDYLDSGYNGGPLINGCGQVQGLIKGSNQAIGVAEILNIARRLNLSVSTASGPPAPSPRDVTTNASPQPQRTAAMSSYLPWAIVGVVLLLAAVFAAVVLRRGGSRGAPAPGPAPQQRPVTQEVPAPSAPAAAPPPVARPRTRVVGINVELVGRGDRRLLITSDDFADSGNIVELYRDERDPTGRGRRRVFLDEPEISNPHACFTYDSLAKQVLITDLRSRNKTYLNGDSQPLGETAVVLKDGDRLVFAGSHEFSVRLSNG